jgi:streptogramin lyase
MSYTKTVWKEDGTTPITAAQLNRLETQYENALADAKAQPTWIGMTGMSGWSNYGAPYNNLQYCKDAAGFVVIRGLVQGGSASTQITVLPTGYRPSKVYCFPVVTANGFARVDVKDDGSVWLNGSFSSFLFLDGIRFYPGA